MRVNEVSAGDFGGAVTLEKRLPDTLRFSDDLCFTSNNSHFTVWIDGKEVYRFETEENLTGLGYGTAFHAVNLSPKDAGASVRIEMTSAFANRSGGRIGDMRLCGGVEYLRMFTAQRFWPAAVSILLLFVGVLMLSVYFWMPKRSALPYDLPALGVATFLFGLWCLNDTGLLRIMTGGLTVYRVMDYYLMQFVGYPMVCFVNSVTQHKRAIYPRISFWLMMGYLSLILGLRCIGGVDLHMMMPLIYVSYFSSLALVVLTLAENHRICRENGVPANLREFSIGAGTFVAGVVVDCVLYLIVPTWSGMHGTFMRLGLCVFVVAMLIQFLRWWSGEHTSIYHDSMTGCRNRRALGEFEKKSLDTSGPYGFVLCDVNGLKKINDTDGHEAGDALIVDVAESLKAVFGAENVYRTGGDEFAAYACGGTAAAFEDRVARLRALISSKERSAAIGAVFREAGSGGDCRQVRSEADMLMYEDKSKYYQGRNDRRR